MRRSIENPPDAELARKLFAGIDAVIRNDAFLIDVGASERCICAHLACYLKPLFPGWNVDVEYNRELEDPKRAGGRGVVPDLIVHRRGTEQNYFVLEMKIGNEVTPDEEDVEKLVDIVRDHGYRVAAFLRLGAHPLGVSCLHWVLPE